MTEQRWQRVKAIFDGAVECDAAGRAAFIHEHCGTDAELEWEVESLLASDGDAGKLTDDPVMEAIRPIANASPIPEAVQKRIGNYIITGELARGGMGIVYRGRHITLPRDVVVKCIRSVAFSDDAQNELRARFRREAHIQSQLDDPHIVRVYEFFVEGEEYFLVMEYVHGPSLKA